MSRRGGSNRPGPLGLVLGLAVAAGGCAIADERSCEGFVSQVAADSFACFGEADLARTDDGITFSGRDDSLPAGDAITAWWLIFNRPENCVGTEALTEATGQACGSEDFTFAQQDAVGFAFGYCDGAIADATGGETGSASFSCARTVADGPFAPTDSTTLLEGALEDPHGAEVHVILRTHGPALAGELGDEQLELFGGGCQFGQPNAGLCYDLGHAPFTPAP